MAINPEALQQAQALMAEQPREVVARPPDSAAPAIKIRLRDIRADGEQVYLLNFIRPTEWEALKVLRLGRRMSSAQAGQSGPGVTDEARADMLIEFMEFVENLSGDDYPLLDRLLSDPEHGSVSARTHACSRNATLESCRAHLAALYRDFRYDAAARFANAVGALKVQQLGAAQGVLTFADTRAWIELQSTL